MLGAWNGLAMFWGLAFDSLESLQATVHCKSCTTRGSSICTFVIPKSNHKMKKWISKVVKEVTSYCSPADIHLPDVALPPRQRGNKDTPPNDTGHKGLE